MKPSKSLQVMCLEAVLLRLEKNYFTLTVFLSRLGHFTTRLPLISPKSTLSAVKSSRVTPSHRPIIVSMARAAVTSSGIKFCLMASAWMRYIRWLSF